MLFLLVPQGASLLWRSSVRSSCHVGDKEEGDGKWEVGPTKRMGGVCVACEDSSSILQKGINGPMHEMSVTEKVEGDLFDKM